MSIDKERIVEDVNDRLDECGLLGVNSECLIEDDGSSLAVMVNLSNATTWCEQGLAPRVLIDLEDFESEDYEEMLEKIFDQIRRNILEALNDTSWFEEEVAIASGLDVTFADKVHDIRKNYDDMDNTFAKMIEHVEKL